MKFKNNHLMKGREVIMYPRHKQGKNVYTSMKDKDKIKIINFLKKLTQWANIQKR